MVQEIHCISTCTTRINVGYLLSASSVVCQSTGDSKMNRWEWPDELTRPAALSTNFTLPRGPSGEVDTTSRDFVVIATRFPSRPARHGPSVTSGRLGRGTTCSAGPTPCGRRGAAAVVAPSRRHVTCGAPRGAGRRRGGGMSPATVASSWFGLPPSAPLRMACPSPSPAPSILPIFGNCRRLFESLIMCSESLERLFGKPYHVFKMPRSVFRAAFRAWKS